MLLLHDETGGRYREIKIQTSHSKAERSRGDRTNQPTKCSLRRKHYFLTSHLFLQKMSNLLPGRRDDFINEYVEAPLQVGLGADYAGYFFFQSLSESKTEMSR